jgi:hypothetical protein
LLLWLHGARERGDDNLEQLRWMDLVFAALPLEENDYFILAPQCPPDEEFWFHERGLPLCDCADDTATETMTVAAAWVGSAQPHVVSMIKADAGTRTVAKDADISVSEHLVTRAGGEPTSLAELGGD